MVKQDLKKRSKINKYNKTNVELNVLLPNAYTKEMQTGDKIVEQPQKGYNGVEDDLQKECENYLKEQKILYIHIPKSAYRTGKMKGKAGIPDLIIFRESFNCYPRVLLIELKNKYGKPTQGQRNFAKRVRIYIVRNLIYFKSLVDDFMEYE